MESSLKSKKELVHPVKPVTIDVAPDTVNLTSGGSQVVTVTIEGATNKMFMYETSDADVAQPSAQSETELSIYGDLPGSATVKVYSVEDNTVFKNIPVTVGAALRSAGLTSAQLKVILDDADVKYASNTSKPELQALVDGLAVDE